MANIKIILIEFARIAHKDALNAQALVIVLSAIVDIITILKIAINIVLQAPISKISNALKSAHHLIM